MRYRLTFAKTTAMRFTGHLDLHRTWERTFRRAGLPLVYSQGYNPRPRLQLASALPLGFTSQGEVIDFRLEHALPTDEITDTLLPALPPGLELLEIEEIELRAPALQTQLQESEFIITFLDPFPDLQQRCMDLLDAGELPRERRGKPYDLRPLVLELMILENDQDGCQRLYARLSAREGTTARPEELVLALGGAPETTRVHRIRLIFQSETPS
jgi:radical SAM-linked protein